MKRFLRESFLAWTERNRRSTITSLGVAPQLFGAIAAPLSWIYRAGVGIDRMLRKPAAKTISSHQRLAVVASPLVGGVGKTPLVASLGSAAASRGRKVSLVTRGYARETSAPGTILTDPTGANLDRTGDEAVMLTQDTKLPVHVARHPEQAIDQLGRDAETDLIILDDGVRRRWTGEKRILVFSDDDLLGPIDYIPSGRWRVPIQYALPAHGIAIISTASQQDSDRTDARRQEQRDRLQAWGCQLPVGWYESRVVGFFPRTKDGLGEKMSLPDGSPLVFCGLGHPSRFMEQLHAYGIRPAGHMWLPDHHSYSRRDLEALSRMARNKKATAMLTTHKDAVKIRTDWIEEIPLFVMRISLELIHGTDMLSIILEPNQ